MKQISEKIDDIGQLKQFLSSAELREDSKSALSILVQIYTASTDELWLQVVAKEIETIYPSAKIVGATSTGEIFKGQSLLGQTIVTFSFFQTTTVHSFVIECSAGEELEVGRRLRLAIDDIGGAISAAMLLTTPHNIDSNKVILSLNYPLLPFDVFGGGSGDYTNTKSLVIFGSTIYSAAGIVVAFESPDFRVEMTAYLGWNPMSIEMTATSASGSVIQTIDKRPAFEVYQRYLDIQDDKNFFSNAIGFPLLAYRDDQIIARVPVAVGPNGALIFISDVMEGEKFRLGFADPEFLRNSLIAVQRKMEAFEPEAILLFTCGCRRWVLREDAEAETIPFEAIAPTAGFYTTGEFCNQGGKLFMLNLAFVAVGMREGPPKMKSAQSKNPINTIKATPEDVFASSHTVVISRLLHFINVINAELEQANNELMIRSITDKLTQIYNRLKLDESLSSELARAKRAGSPFSVVLLDIDHFKQVNDIHGHNVGDAVLVCMAEILRESVRATDILGRWGGEEFLILLPDTGPDQAYGVAEKIRVAIADAVFPVVNHKTVSIGATSYMAGDNVIKLLCRADKALYKAKGDGRNKSVLL